MKNIYQITNLKNGKIYIGQTTKDVHCRWAEHIANSKRGKNNVLYKAMRKYGIDNFEVKIIEKLNEKDSLDEREIYWIKEKKSLVPNGYNMIYGGRYFKDDNPMFHEEIRKKISKYFIGNNNPAKRPEVREKIRKKALGRKISDETRKKMSINNGRY